LFFLSGFFKNEQVVFFGRFFYNNPDHNPQVWRDLPCDCFICLKCPRDLLISLLSDIIPKKATVSSIALRSSN